MNKPSDMSLYDAEAIEYLLSLVEPIKPPKEQISNGLFSTDYLMGRSRPRLVDKYGLTYDYWGG